MSIISLQAYRVQLEALCDAIDENIDANEQDIDYLNGLNRLELALGRDLTIVDDEEDDDSSDLDG